MNVRYVCLIRVSGFSMHWMGNVCSGRSRMTTDPQITIDRSFVSMPERSTSVFHRPGRHCLHQAQSAVRCWASRTKGKLHPTKNHLWDGLSRLWMTASKKSICFGKGAEKENTIYDAVVGASCTRASIPTYTCHEERFTSRRLGGGVLQ